MRAFLGVDDLGELVREVFGSDRRPVGLDRLAGGTKKGVYRLRLDDATTTILYYWAPAENYWPEVASVPGDPFADPGGAERFRVNHQALAGAGVRVPEMLLWKSDLALVEDAGELTLERLMESDPSAAAGPLASLGAALRRMHTTYRPHYGPLTLRTPPERPAEDLIVDRALVHLDAVATQDARLAAARHRIADHLLALRERVSPRQTYALVHGELGPDHVLITSSGEPVMIDIEGLIAFDVEWDLAWTEMRFEEAYPLLGPVPPDPARLDLYRYAQVLSLIEGPLRIAGTDFPERQWMLDLAEWNIGKALAPIERKDRGMTKLTGQQIAAEGLTGWVLLANSLNTRLLSGDFATGLKLVDAIGAAAEEANHHPDIDLRYPHVDVRLLSHDTGGVTARDVRLARTISALASEAGVSQTVTGVTELELALDTPALKNVMPFWSAVMKMDQTDNDDVRDPAGRLPLIWFQESGRDEPRQRWHPDVWVDPAEVQPRIEAAIAAGGTLVSDAEAPSFWVLADPEGNRVCLCTWQQRAA
jgi:pterin-4a-carbinolamine dehydratase